MAKKLPKIIVVLGPTASGKTDLGIFLAKKFGGEVINADSRQVYKGMDIGTAKVAPKLKTQNSKLKNKEEYIVDGVPHHLIDIVNPEEEFTLSDFKKLALVKIDDILKRGKLPIIVGGTGLYIQAIVDNLDIPKVAPDKKLRAELEKLTLAELVEKLKIADPEAYTKVDLQNPRRVLRALEVVLTTGQSFVRQQTKSAPLFDVLQIGLKWPREELYNRINQRVDVQIKNGLVDEVRDLSSMLQKKLTQGCFGNSPRAPSWKEGEVWRLPSMSGIGYRQFKDYLEGKSVLAEAMEKLKRDTRNYAKKQETWFKRDQRILWLKGETALVEAEKIADNFIIQN